MRKFVVTLALTAACLALLPADRTAADEPASPDARPNIVFILTDDQSPTALGILGHPQLKTPHLDTFFRQGAMLTGAFVTTPVCSPSRAGLISSRYSSEVRILDYINPRAEPDLGLASDWVTWPELLAQAGYATGLVGKWHLGTADEFRPQQQGYQHFAGFRVGGITVKDPKLEIDGETRRVTGLTTDILTDLAIDFVRKQADGPFLLSLHYRAPHAPWLPLADEDWAPYRDLDPMLPEPEFPKLDTAKVKQRTREYLGSVASVDRNVGRLLAALDELKLTENTLVVFTSDHGYHHGHHGLWYKGNAQWQLTELPQQQWPHIPRLQRPNMYDQTLRVPAAVRWPAKIRPGTKVTETLSNLDWYPTLLAAAGVPIPAGVTIRGRNFLPLLEGQPLEWDNDLYAEYSMRHGAQTDMRTYRTPDWKLTVDFNNPGRAELYDLRRDPGEQTNLIDSQDPRVQQIAGRLRSKIFANMKSLGDPALDLKQ